jgi:hypothetical protein
VFLPGNPKWPDGPILMQLELGSSGTLTDGSTSWGASAETALAIWNQYLDRVQFTVVRNSTAAIGDGNGLNNVLFQSAVFGRSFPTGALAVTTTWSRGGVRTEGDVIFNTTYSFNSYRGNLNSGTSTSRVYDFQRIALHEFGHVLGLDHPDQAGQNVVAQMNSTVSNLDTLAADDIAGARALYSSAFGNGTVAFPPRNETLDFRSQLETEYKNVLHRSAAVLTTVDTTGDAVWTSEYLRYRVNQCSDATATQKVIDEINGFPAPEVCGSSPIGQVNFPPRNESLNFRISLEATYRDVLHRGTNATAVDNEGDVVWTQEYLRYRVNACDHPTAVTKVLQQIEGKGTQPVCR